MTNRIDMPQFDQNMIHGHSFFSPGTASSRVFRRALFPAMALYLGGVSCMAASFDEQRKTMSATIESQPEEAVLSLLKSGNDEGKPTQAIAEARKWLRQNLPNDPMLLFHAGRAAELSGDAGGSAALYGQYLKQADPQAATTGQAFIAVHALLKDQLNDISAAYSANKSVGNRLAGNPTVRQFDQWFLQEAMTRRDVVAVANRLHAVIKAGIPDDLRTTFYDSYFRWLLEQVDGYVEVPNAIPMTAEVVDAYKQLAAAMTFNEELALRMNWAVSVRVYNAAKIAGEEAAPPIAEAKALLAKFPRYAQWVQTGWAGGGNGQHYRNDPAKYWTHETEAKMAPIVEAVPKLTPLELAGLLASWIDRYYADNVVRPMQVRAVRDYVRPTPGLWNIRHGVLILPRAWNELTQEAAQSLEEKTARLADPQASLVRAIAAGGKDFDKVMAAFLGPEVWRLGPNELNGQYVDQLWHYCGKPGDAAKRDAEIARSKAVAATIVPPDAKAAPAQRLGLFRTLWADFRSNQPKIPGVVSQLKAILAITPEAIPELLNDQSVEAQMLARNAIAAGFVTADPIWVELEAANQVNTSTYAPGIVYLAQRHAGGSVDELKKRHPQKCIPHPLEAAMRKSVADSLAGNGLEAWQLMAWINMQYPENNEEQIKLIQAVMKSPAWNSMPFEVHYAARQWFGKAVMTPGQIAWIDAADPALVSKDLLALVVEVPLPENGTPHAQPIVPIELDEAAKAAKAAEDVKAASAALQSTIAGIEKSPIRITISDKAMENLATLDPAVFADAATQELILKLIDQLKNTPATVNFGNRLLAAVEKNRDPTVLHRVAPFLWEHINRHIRSFDTVKLLTQSLVNDSPSAASALASAGLDAFERHRGHMYFNREVDVPLLKSVRGSAAMQMGLIVIPVAKNHPAYPIYQAQGDWVTGNEDSAWDLIDQHWEAFPPVQRELSIPFVLWTLQRTIYGRDEARQESLIKSLLAWAEEAGSPLSPTEKAQIEIAYGDIAMQRGQLNEAHKIYSATQSKEPYQELSIRYTAALRRVDAERVARDFDGALNTLTELERDRVSEIWEPIRYARALVYFDMEEFEDAKDDIDSILARNPDQADAKILLGKVQLKRQKLMEATEVELGTAASQKSLVPGERLKVTLVDPTLAVSGAGTEIEVVVWSTSGDKETFFLRQFGDSKTKFRGEVATALGAPAPGDDILQVIGDDEVFYAYSENFRKKMNNLEEKRGGPIVVASDAILMASARKLLTEAEQRTADMESVMNSIAGDTTEGAAKAAMAARSMSAEARAEEDGFSEAEFERFVTNVAKPGNPIHVRVIDPDRSRSAEIDELNISVSTSSGDSVSRVTLKETGTHSGWFEGSIPTTGAQALAYSQNSEPGRNPNMVISPQADTYPAWRPLAAEGTLPEFSVDLNDNVAIGELTILAKESGAKLKNFYLQTGMNNGEMTTIASFPRASVSPELPWNPSVVVMNDTDIFHARGERKLREQFAEVVDHFERGWMAQQFAQNFVTNVAGVSECFPAKVIEDVKWQRQARYDVSSVIYRFKGHFYEKEDVQRRFRLNLGNFAIPKETHPSINHQPQFLLVVNGRPVSAENGDLDGTVNLKEGLHTFEIWATGWVANIGFGKREMKLQANLGDAESLVDVPDAFFDPTTFPKDALNHRNASAKVTANADGTEFKVQFAPDSRARLLKLVFLDQEGAVPALNKLALKGAQGEGILPVAEDFATLNKNNTLEILTGDKIAVRYIDDRFVTKTKERLERSLEVSFTDARAEFADMEPRFDAGKGEDKPYYEKLLRFQYDKPLSLAIHDADMDVSVEPDKVKVTLSTEVGGKREFEALETGDSTGVFKLIVVPVQGAAAEGNKIQVAVGGTITASYLDQENNRPGVPTERIATIDQAAFYSPEFRISHATVTPLETETMQTLIHGFERINEANSEDKRIVNERIRPRWQIENTLLPSKEAPEGGFHVVHGRTAHLELIAPHLSLGTASAVTVYAQTDSGRQRAGASADGFDIKVPGTVALTATTGQIFGHQSPWRGVPQIEIYQGGDIPSTSTPQYDRFKLSVPLVAEMPLMEGALTYEEIAELREEAKNSRSAAAALDQIQRIKGLVVKPGERIHFGFQYTDVNGQNQWVTASAKVVTHPAFDIMTADYREPMTSAYVGESLNLRVVDLGADTTDDSDTVSVLVQGKSGEKHLVELRESGPHTGIFKADPVLSYAPTKEQSPAPEGAEESAVYDVRNQGFPVVYGDTVAARYTDANGVKTEVAMVTVSKGADGSIQPFSKVYEDAEIATRTQFSLAEAYLEMAKRHRKLGQEEAAAIEYASAKQLLSKAMDEFSDPETRAHAEYLLGTLTMEEADATEDPEMRETRYRAALSRFLSVTGSYPQTLHASKAQYQIATLYESLKEPEIAAQEYVKLAYKYPDSEYLATSMARLGSHFLKTAAAHEAKAKPLLEQLEDKDAQFEGQALQKMAVREYIKTAQIFGRLQQRFPSDSLAGQAGLRAGQAFMRAEKKQEAVDAFERVMNDESYDGPDIRAQAMYWMGMCFQDLRQQMAAYSTFKRLTYDFPESKWAAYARAQLSQEALLNLETKLELERLESEE